MEKLKKIIVISFLSLFLTLNFPSLVYAQPDIKGLLKTTAETGAGFENIGSRSLAFSVGSVITFALSFLGVLFIIFIIYSGFLYMTARGDSEQITKAKDIMINAVIGLVIITSSYTITFFILKNLTQATGTYN